MHQDKAVKQQYGGRHARGGGIFGLGCKPNAYMLVYVRKDLIEEDGIEPAPTGSLLHQEVRRAFERALKGLGKKAKASAASLLESVETYL